MDLDQIAALLQPFVSTRPSERQLRQISTYIDMLMKWNRKVNLTAVRDPRQIATRHFGESVFAARLLFPEKCSDHGEAAGAGSVIRLVDVGSGAGFPGLPVKIFAPEVKLTLIESHNKKATFLREVIRSLELADAEVFAGRAEDFPSSSADIVTLRAVERFEEILPVAARLLSAGGRLALLIGQAQVTRAKAALTGFEWREPVAIPRSAARVLLVGSTPAI